MKSKSDLLGDLATMQRLFEYSEAASVCIDTNGKIALVNRKVEQLTGYSKAEIEGNKTWKDFILEEEHDEVSRYLQLLRANPNELSERREIRFRDKENNLHTGLLNAIILPEHKILVLSIVDITEQKAYESDLEKAKAEAEKSEQLKTAFLANMSHEIRTPINSIVGFADLLKMDEIEEEKKALYLEQVIHGSHDLLLLIEKMITIARLDSGQLQLNNREFDLNSKLREIESRFKEELINRHKEDIALRFIPGKKDQSFVIQGDPIRLTEVISNLLENSVKFTDSGRIEFGYYYLDEDASEMEGEGLLFYVKDSGSGIEKSKTKMVFDRFVKVIEKEETIYKGAGLGLTICREVVNLFGGSIWVESTKDSGSRFFFTYPLGKTKIKKASEKKEKSTEHASMDWSEKEILIAEDVESNYLYIKELLSPTQVRILRARDGIEALDIFRNHAGIDLVIMDILMPGMDGYEATTEIRNLKPEIPVIAQSAFTFEGDIQDGLYAGCFNDYIMKPYTRKVLLAVINKYFSEE